MPPHRRTFVDILTDDEKVLMDIAVRLVSALQYREKNLDTVEDAWYGKCISDELEDSETVFKKYDHRPDKPRIHPIITHVGEEWDSAKDDHRDPDVTVLDLNEMHRLCDEGAVENPSWNTQLHMKPLDKLIGLQDAAFRWWLPAKRMDDIAAGQHADPFSVNTGSGSITKPTPAPARDAPTVDEDVEMGDEDEGETPGKAKKAQKRPAVQSPTPARRETSRRKGASGSAIVESSPESEAEGLAPTKPLPVKPVPSAPAPVKPKVRRRVSGVPHTGSGDEIPPPGPRKKVKRPASVVDESASELEDGPTDLGACGPCKVHGRKCKPQKPAKKGLALACRRCVKRRIKCDPISAVAQELLDSKKKNTLQEVIERVDAMARAQTLHNTAMYDFVYNIDTMIRAVCTQGPGNVNLSTLRLRKPPVPPFVEDRPATPSASSVASAASGAPSSVSSMGLGRMTLHASGMSDASEIPLDLVQDEPSRQRLRSRSAHSGTTSNAQSKAGSRQSSRGRK
ncbi:hypothetical protein EDB85DRAFT_1889090 [Lactarius pseudohatsudake]|nr:hypothetical protein EDB85DRAFT_1889090 [Lactarius pseudohatsudake]